MGGAIEHVCAESALQKLNQICLMPARVNPPNNLNKPGPDANCEKNSKALQEVAEHEGKYHACYSEEDRKPNQPIFRKAGAIP
jgi:hypothetical protein